MCGTILDRIIANNFHFKLNLYSSVVFGVKTYAHDLQRIRRTFRLSIDLALLLTNRIFQSSTLCVKNV